MKKNSQIVTHELAKVGIKVKVTEASAKNGTQFDQENVKKQLKLGKVYIVEAVYIGEWRTGLLLEGINLPFNAVNFVLVEE